MQQQPPLLCRGLREMCLAFYDKRATVVEVLARANGLAQLGSMTHYKRQLTAIEALQIYVPLAHALGMAATAAEMEDRCFKARQQLCLPMLFGSGGGRGIMAGAVMQGLKDQAGAFLKASNALNRQLSWGPSRLQ